MEAQNKKLVGVFSALLILIVGLTIGLVFVIKNRNVLETEDIAVQVLPNLNCDANNYETEIRDELSKLDSESETEEGILIYQACIEKLAPEVQAELYTERATWVLNTDWSEEYSEQAIADIVAADDILKNIDSARNVINIANSCGDTEVADRYYKILSGRQEDDGINLGEEVTG